MGPWAVIPLNAWTPIPQPVAFNAPGDEPYVALSEIVRGGVGISDGGQGRDVQDWTFYYTGTDIKIKDEAGVDEYTLTVAGVLTLSGSFDANMRPAMTYQTAGGSVLYYYSTVAEAYDTITIADGTSCRVALDDYRDIYNAASDILWFYVRGTTLYWRQQRDRYVTEYTVGAVTAGMLLKRVGQNVQRRFQCELRSA